MIGEGNAAPSKWRKYLKLVEYDLITQEELTRDIRRFDLGDAVNMSHCLREEMMRDEDLGRSSLYVVKLVSLKQFGQLPNLRIEKKEDLKHLRGFFDGHSGFVEIWYCRTAIDPGVFSVAGRLSVYYNNSPRSHVIEQVWRCSPRLIESFSKHATFPYARAFRLDWGRHYNIEELYCPRSVSIDPHVQLAQFRQSLMHIERAQERIITFLEFAEGRGIESISLEYKLIDDHLSIIDWDTSNDSKLIGT